MKAVSSLLAVGLALAASGAASAAERSFSGDLHVPAAVQVTYAGNRSRHLPVRIWRRRAWDWAARRGYRCYDVTPYFCPWPAYDTVAVGPEPGLDDLPDFRNVPAPPWRSRSVRHRRQAVVSTRG